MIDIEQVMPTKTYSGARFACLDLCDVRWSRTPGAAGSELAILLEIWRSGGLFQTSAAIPKDSTVTITTGNGPVNGMVRSCQQDDYGFLVEVGVVEPQNWFPRAYQPALLLRRNRLAA
jgi:hypothetical protein